MMVGRHTPETRAKIRSALVGRARPQAVREKIAATKRGKKATPKTRMNLRVAQRVIKLFKPDLYQAHVERKRAEMRANMQDPAFLERWRAGREKMREKSRAACALRFTGTRNEQLVTMRAAGMTQRAIAARLGVSQPLVHKILKARAALTRFSDMEGT